MVPIFRRASAPPKICWVWTLNIRIKHETIFFFFCRIVKMFFFFSSLLSHGCTFRLLKCACCLGIWSILTHIRYQRNDENGEKEKETEKKRKQRKKIQFHVQIATIYHLLLTILLFSFRFPSSIGPKIYAVPVFFFSSSLSLAFSQEGLLIR